MPAVQEEFLLQARLREGPGLGSSPQGHSLVSDPFPPAPGAKVTVTSRTTSKEDSATDPSEGAQSSVNMSPGQRQSTRGEAPLLSRHPQRGPGALALADARRTEELARAWAP